MKHGVSFRKLNRTSAHRQAMLRTMVTQLIEHDRIRTTLPKAKELRRQAEKVVAWAKKGDEVSRKRAEGYVRTPEAITKLFDVMGPRYTLREGGYTRILKADFRRGDGAEMAVIEYVDRPGEMRKAKPPTGIEAARQAFEATSE
ncbi:hypothetical protein BBO99_00007292 [Phytophthora kernoviae]|uniref:Large ribosomal subunit protein bL17c n=2 Tax=Phytophthora kernoviae TaxID=325452 RepID=A0A3R7JWV2_9STRA|nr:hypothetical protein G195_006269 [Phytophthora kernoviae 00238/432]KAG2520003.1 hypothetical protein JM16_006913 [Phytophthora kernoviae]KAG2520965.1 hypothetical protein JM18_006822 [Phytophthora kernoviae]RLN37133.1 hypothetical protein BBI17_007265 [Phytophthora kernoviae]RLN76765.1 hypothetical protein BBO99_00007292 [Phytophthora kernoviae]